MCSLIYSRLSLSRIPRDSLKHFEISIPRHIRVQRVRKTIKMNEYVIWQLIWICTVCKEGLSGLCRTRVKFSTILCDLSSVRNIVWNHLTSSTFCVICFCCSLSCLFIYRVVSTPNHKVPGLNPAGGRFQLITFIITLSFDLICDNA